MARIIAILHQSVYSYFFALLTNRRSVFLAVDSKIRDFAIATRSEAYTLHASWIRLAFATYVIPEKFLWRRSP